MTRYTSLRFFVLTGFVVLVLLALLRRIEGLTQYEQLGWIAFFVFGVWSFIVVRQGASILKQSPKSSFFLTFQMAVTGMKFFLLIIFMLFYGKFGYPETHAFAWYLLATFLPFFIYETWAFAGMSRIKTL